MLTDGDTISGIVLAAVAIVVIAGGAGGFYLFARRGDSKSGKRVPAKKTGAASGAAASADAEAIEETKSILRGVLDALAHSIAGLLGNSARFGSTLDKHRSSLQKMATIDDLRELEQTMLTQVEEVIAENERYRKELDEANALVVTQQGAMEQLQTDAGTDHLTQLPNRRSLERRLVEAFDRAERYNHSFSVIIFDIDHFKQVNDEHGHLAGDRILRAIANILDGQRRASDFLARYGGEEFTLLLPETSLESARMLAEKTRQKIAISNFKYEDTSIRVTLSAGVGEVQPASDTLDSLIKRVDEALYRAKESGRNRVEVAET